LWGAYGITGVSVLAFFSVGVSVFVKKIAGVSVLEIPAVTVKCLFLIGVSVIRAPGTVCSGIYRPILDKFN